MLYLKARDIFIYYSYINHIPVIDKDRNVVDIMSRQRAFWKEEFDKEKLPRMHYAHCIWSAAMEAVSLGYKAISVLEFGVAAGNSLVNCEFHAKEISRLLGIEIQVYGFDKADGLPMDNMGYKDMIHIWPGGKFKMDIEKLKNRLRFAQLVLGDIRDTANTFFETFKPAPVGCMLIDVDYYSSTLPILDMLEKSDEYFMPRVQMYFDDIVREYEFSGEMLAIKEFNLKHEQMKISPEGFSHNDYREKTKVCHRFFHKKYNTAKK